MGFAVHDVFHRFFDGTVTEDSLYPSQWYSIVQMSVGCSGSAEVVRSHSSIIARFLDRTGEGSTDVVIV
jgi:hypothetical protein